jgi:predicted lipoprotein with Yx(FWY)xxD motif
VSSGRHVAGRRSPAVKGLNQKVAYNGHPLYYFTADTAAGTAHGQAVKAFGA